MLRFWGVFASSPDRLGLKAAPDEPLDRWEQTKGREKQIKAIRDAIDKILKSEEELLAFLKASALRDDGLFAAKDPFKLSRLFFLVMEAAGVCFTKKDEIGIMPGRACASALHALAFHAQNLATDDQGNIRHGREMVFFSRVVFDEKKDWLTYSFDEIMHANGALSIFCEALEAMGFVHEVYIDGRRLSMNYYREYAKNPLR